MSRLSGAWEPKGYLGPRVEIRGRRLVRLWRGTPVLTAAFAVRREGKRTVLELSETALRHAGTAEPYAEMKQCFLEDGALTLVDEFPITGESTDVLYPTVNSRYGNVELMPEVLRQLRGVWRSSQTEETITIRGRRLICGYAGCAHGETEIAAVRSRSSGQVHLVDRDPGRDMVVHFTPIEVRGDRLVTSYPVCDAPSVPLEFERAGK